MVNTWLIFNFAGIEGFLISIWGFRQDGRPSVHSQKFDRARLKEKSRRSHILKAGNTRFQAQERFP